MNPKNFQMPRLNGGRPDPVGIQVAAPLNDYQIVGLMAAALLAQAPAPAADDLVARNGQAELAVRRAIDLLGHAAYQTGKGVVASTINGGMATGQEHAKAAAEAEERAARGEQPPPKLITGTDDA